MNNTSDVWLNIEEVCSLTNSKKETIRRKCKSGEYKCRFELAGRNKNYQILLSSMPLKYIEKYKSCSIKIIYQLSITEHFLL